MLIRCVPQYKRRVRMTVRDVRIVILCWRKDTSFVYFSTFPDNDKVGQIDMKPHMVFTVVPATGNAHVRAGHMPFCAGVG